jgi:hypothetical protein
MTRSVALLFAVASLSIACHAQQGQQAQTGPSLQETFDWMRDTLKPTKRFIKAFRHAVELCGDKPSTF